MASVKDLLTFIFHSIVDPGAVITQKQFEEGLKSGAFSLILDGFDEVDFDQRKNIEDQILKLRENYPELMVIVSSRPDPDKRFESWTRFHVAYVAPMDEEQVIELISKVDYDQKIKKQFLKSLRDGLFDTHDSFLSNPLLCLMMLVTFEQTGHIPDKKHIFYEHAFDALFFLHDSAKEGVYRRKTYANLPIDDFRNCLSAFCIVSYAKEKISFSQSDLRDIVSQALKIEKREINIKEFISDLIESTCLLQLEGVEYVFTHRSFQEYFGALFIARSPATNLCQLLDQLSKRREDDLIPMAFAMNRHLLERDWIVPKLREFQRQSSALSIDRDLVEYVNNIYGRAELRFLRGKPAEFFYRGLRPDAHAWFAFAILYPDNFDPIYAWAGRQKKEDGPRIEATLHELSRRNDPRIPAQIASTRLKRKFPASFEFPLQASDNIWLRKTRLPEYFKRFSKAQNSLLVAIEKDMKDQIDILQTLLPQ